jgi:hypothetical protein
MNEGTNAHPRFDVWYPIQLVQEGYHIIYKVSIDKVQYYIPYDVLLKSLRVTIDDNYLILKKFP